MAAECNKRARKPDFTETETRTLLLAISPRYKIINGSLHTGEANRKRRHAWEEVAEAVNSVGKHHRTKEQVQKRWKDLKNSVKNKSAHAMGTGGGPPQGPVPFEEQILLILGGSSTLAGFVKEDGDTYNGYIVAVEGEEEWGNTGTSLSTSQAIADDEFNLPEDENKSEAGADETVYDYSIPNATDCAVIFVPPTAGSSSQVYVPASPPVLSSGIPSSSNLQFVTAALPRKMLERSATLPSVSATTSKGGKSKTSSKMQLSSPVNFTPQTQDEHWIAYLKSATNLNNIQADVGKIQKRVLKKEKKKLKLQIKMIKHEMSLKGIEEDDVNSTDTDDDC